MSYVWSSLRRAVSEELVSGIRYMTLLADNMGAVFDVPLTHAEEIDEAIRTKQLWSCELASAPLPALRAREFQRQGGGGFGGRGGFGGGRGGSSGGFSRGGGSSGGFSRGRGRGGY